MRGLRAKTLEAAIERLLAGADAKNDSFGLPLIKSLSNKNEAKPSYLVSDNLEAQRSALSHAG